MKPADISSAVADWPKVTEDEPFGPGVAVYKVAGKVFAILQGENHPPQVTLKCEPALAMELRAQFPAVHPGYHMNKTHWNTVVLDGSIPEPELHDMLEHSYARVVAGLPKAVRAGIALRND